MSLENDSYLRIANIDRFKRLLEQETDLERRRVLLRLLAEAEEGKMLPLTTELKRS